MLLSNPNWQPSLEMNDCYFSATTQSPATRNLTHWLFSTDCNSSVFLKNFFINCVPFYLGPTGPAAAVVAVIRLLWQEARAREWRHATFHPELMCQAYHTAERSGGDILHWISDISRTVQIYPSLSGVRLDFSIHRVSILITEKRMSEDFLFSST